MATASTRHFVLWERDLHVPTRRYEEVNVRSSVLSQVQIMTTAVSPAETPSGH